MSRKVTGLFTPGTAGTEQPAPYGLPTPCLIHPGAQNNDGYVLLTRNGRWWRAHRYAYTLAHGPIPEDLEVRHKCDNPPCVNIDHLELGTHTDNMRDLFDRDRRKNGTKGERVNTAQLTEEQVYAIREATEGLSELGRRYGVYPSTIRRIKSRETWKHLPERVTNVKVGG